MNGTEKTRAAATRFLATRIFGPMESFKMGGLAPEGATDVIGVYDAPGGPGPVWVTASGLVLPSGDAFEALPYLRMREVHSPYSKDKENAESARVRVVLDDGKTVTLDIVGGRGRFCDSFQFTRFLMRASEFAREPSETPG